MFLEGSAAPDPDFPLTPLFAEFDFDVEDPSPEQLREAGSFIWMAARGVPGGLRPAEESYWISEVWHQVSRRLEFLRDLARLFRRGSVRIALHAAWRIDDEGALVQVLNNATEQLDNPDMVDMVVDLYSCGLEVAGFLKFVRDHLVTAYTASTLKIPLSRFSSSTERADLADRLVDMIIVLEALFSEAGETSYKVAARSAAFTYPPGEARLQAFKRVQGFYNVRNAILHGRTPKNLTAENVDALQDHVRRILVKLLDHLRHGKGYAPGDFDHFLLFPWKP